MLEIANIDAGYGGFQALFDVSMKVDAGEAVAVLGANGAGKTTLLRVISGLLPASRGAITMDGVSLRAIAPHRIVEAGIAHVPESRRLFPRLSVESNLKMGAFVPEARKHFAERLDYVYGLFPRLEERRHQLAGTMSGGEQQMIAIGRCLMGAPELIMFDEPSLGLAPLVVQEVLRTIRMLNQRRLTILLVEQNVAVSLKISNRAYVLENGRVVMSGSGEKLLHDDRVRQAYLGL